MSVYIMTGKLGAGKTLAAVGRIRDYLNQGRRVATNLDLFMEAFKNPWNRKVDVIRLPDKPEIEHLESLGRGHDLPYPDESRNGLLVLDECGTWFNARNWNDPARKKVIDWFLHARKLRWDVIFVAQDISLLDKQARDALAEHTVFVKRLDRLRLPLVGKITKLFGFEIRPPKVHLAIVKYGDTAQHPTVDKWYYRGTDLFKLYDTEQVFTDSQTGNYSYLTPWHIKGRYIPRRTLIDYLNDFLLPVLKITVFYPVYYCSVLFRPPRQRWAKMLSVVICLIMVSGLLKAASIEPAGCLGVSAADCNPPWGREDKRLEARADQLKFAQSDHAEVKHYGQPFFHQLVTPKTSTEKVD